MENKLTMKKVFVGYLVFLLIWSLRIILLKPCIDANLTGWTKEIVNGAIKSAIWLGFSLYLIRKYNQQLPIRNMLKNRINVKLLLLGTAIVVVYQVILMFIYHKGIYFNPAFQPSQLIGTFLLVGVLEEFVFRGWFLNSLSIFTSETKANLISSVLFLLIHYPSYIVGGTPSLILTNSVGIFIASLLFGWSYKKSKSLWVPIILHMLWDLLSITIV